MVDGSFRDCAAWLAWTFTTATSGLMYRLAKKPSPLSFLISFVSDEFSHLLAAVQLFLVVALAKFNPRVLHTDLGKLFCLINMFTVGLHVRSSVSAMQSLKVYQKQLSASNIKTHGLDGGFMPMLLALLTMGSRRFLPEEVVSEERTYADMVQVDPDMVELNNNTSKSMKKLMGYTGRGRRAKWLNLDVIRKRDKGKSGQLLPVLLYIHGGGWGVGDKNFACRPMLEYIASSQDIVVVSINYRLAPERAFPAQLVDAKRALIWVKRNISDYGGDPARIAVAGESAGGHLSAMMNVTQNNPKYQPEEDAEADTSVLSCVVLYGATDIAEDSLTPFVQRVLIQKDIKDHPKSLTDACPGQILNELIDEAQDDESSQPSRTLIIHGDHDVLVPVRQASKFHEKLKTLRKTKKSTIDDVHVVLPGAHHAFGYTKCPRAISTALAISDFVIDSSTNSRL